MKLKLFAACVKLTNLIDRKSEKKISMGFEIPSKDFHGDERLYLLI